MLQLAYTPFIWPFVVSIIITTGLGTYAYSRRHSPVVATFMWLMIALTVWTFCYILELSSVTLEGKIFWLEAKYFGSAVGPILWFILAIRLTHNERLLTRPFQMFLTAFVATTIVVVFTNNVHHWYWTDIWMVDGFPETQTNHGFFFWIYAVSNYLAIVLGVFLIFQYYRSTPAVYRLQATLMGLGGFVPLGGRILEDFFGIDIFPMVDNVILLLLLSGICFALAIFRYGALELVHIAHDVIIQNISAGIIVVDGSERVIELNPYATALIDPGRMPAIGRLMSQALPEGAGLITGQADEQEIVAHIAGGERYFQAQRSALRLADNTLAGYALVLVDITARKEAERLVAELARLDPLTGVMNRRSFFEQAEPELTRSLRYRHPFALLLFDVDYFKKINDNYGHLAGDHVLQEIASLCQRSMRQSDILARYGGEEFICLLTEISAEDALLIAERLRLLVESHHMRVDEKSIRATISIGLSVADLEAPRSLRELIDCADQALYRAKGAGRNRVELWRTAHSL